jgi:hypothetical protein
MHSVPSWLNQIQIFPCTKAKGVVTSDKYEANKERCWVHTVSTPTRSVFQHVQALKEGGGSGLNGGTG